MGVSTTLSYPRRLINMSTSITVTDETYCHLPNTKVLHEAGALRVENEGSIGLSFNTLYTVSNNQKRQVIVFIRHFFCGACEEYIKAISRTYTPEELASPSTSVVIIGCGDADLITDRRKSDRIPFTVYVYPGLKLFDKLGMPKTNAPFMEGWSVKQSEYHGRSFF